MLANVAPAIHAVLLLGAQGSSLLHYFVPVKSVWVAGMIVADLVFFFPFHTVTIITLSKIALQANKIRCTVHLCIVI